MAGVRDATAGRSVPQRGAGDGRRRVCGQATATRPVLTVCTLLASASDPLTLNPGYVGPPPRPPGFASPVFGNRLKTNRVARGHHGLPVSSKSPPLLPSRWPPQVHRRSPMSSAAAPAGLSSGALEVTGKPSSRGPGPPEQARYPAARAPARRPPVPADERFLEGATNAPQPTKVSPLHTPCEPAQGDETGSGT